MFGVGLGEPIEAGELEPVLAAGGACTRFLIAPPGELVAVHGVDDAAALERVEDPAFSPADRIGAVLALGSDREQAVVRARRAADLLRFEVARSEISGS